MTITNANACQGQCQRCGQWCLAAEAHRILSDFAALRSVTAELAAVARAAKWYQYCLAMEDEDGKKCIGPGKCPFEEVLLNALATISDAARKEIEG